MCERSDLEEYNPSSWIWVFTDLGWIRTLIRSGMKLFRSSYTFSYLRKFEKHSFMTSDKLILTKSPTISCSNASTLSSQESYNLSRVRETPVDQKTGDDQWSLINGSVHLLSQLGSCLNPSFLKWKVYSRWCLDFWHIERLVYCKRCVAFSIGFVQLTSAMSTSDGTHLDCLAAKCYPTPFVALWLFYPNLCNFGAP